MCASCSMPGAGLQLHLRSSPKEILDECRAQRIPTIGITTTPDEAILLEEAGVDVIVASGFEAVGHRGSFMHSR
jgi:nitronate monooxygenase